MLAELVATEVAPAKQPFAERVGQWLDFRDAISLFSALNDGAQQGAQQGALAQSAPASVMAALQQAFSAVRTALAEGIVADGLFTPGKVKIKLPAPIPGDTDSVADFAPYHRYYLAHQRDMAASIGPLRANVRAALAGHSPALKRLADLDAVLEQALGAQERNLLATVPLFLAKRFEHLYKAQLDRAPEAAALDDPQRSLAPDGWFALFCQDMQSVLLAELDLRLQPVVGLMAALGGGATTR